MKTYKELNKDINKIIDKYNSKHFNRYDVIMQVKAELEEYYKCNQDQIEKDALLKKHKVLSNNRMVILSNVVAMLYGLMGTAFYDFMKEYNNPMGDESVIYFVAYCFAWISLGIFFIHFIKKINKGIYTYKSVYIDEYHAKIIEKYLFEDNNRNVKKVEKRNKTKLKMIKCRRNTRRMRKTR